MPRVTHVKRARRAVPSAGIKVGDSYYWWAFRAPGARSGVKRFSKTPPRQSQLTMSDFWIGVYSLVEEMEDAVPETQEELVDLQSGWEERANEIAQEQQEKLDNMPESLQQGPTGETLQERIDACESWAGDISSVDIPENEAMDDEEDPDRDEYKESLKSAIQEMIDAMPGCS